jgi:hypothetical protein
MSEEKKVIHEVKLDKSIIKLLWVFAVVLLLNALPSGVLIPDAFAQLSNNSRLNVIHGGAITCRGCN